jgi:ATP-binding cassette subfamily A (ABC1) protein 3
MRFFRYLDKVFPGEYGIKYPALFPFMKSYWFPSSADSSVEMHASKQRKDSRFEDESFQDCKIQVDGLVKVFRKNPFKASEFDKKAVNGIVFGMRSGEIFSLLGHNGAGKTTTINMLCGLYEATAGDATVFGRSIRTDMAAIRRSIGFCPQHDVLYPELTVWEHLEFYGRIKGVAEAQLQSEVAHRIGQVGLGGKEHNTGDQLSGGMKRKLSLAIAYLGNSSFVILDEPTAGLDPVSRRFVWDIIQLNKHDKVTLLTTHFMDEADILGDRIGIVANGIMKCCGSSPFLKSRYGIGYHLDFAFPSDFKNVSPVNHAQFIEKIVPGSKQDTGIGSEISFLLPLQGTPHFPQLLRQLDAHKGDLGHESVGLSLTTLEEVFLRVADDADEFHGVGARPDKESPADDVVVTINPSATPKRRRSSVSHQKKLATSDQQSLLKDVDVEPAGGSHEDHFVAIFARRLLQFSPSRNPFNFLFNVVFPIVVIIVAGAVGSNQSQQLVTYPFLLMSPSKALNGNPAVTTIYNAGSSIAEVSPLTVRQQPSTAALIDTLNAKNQNPSSNANMDSAFSFDTTSLKYGLYINRQYTHALPVSLNYLASNFQRTDGQPAVTFTLYSAPLPFRVNTSANGVVTFLLLVMLAFSFVPGYVVSKAVSERVSKARHLLRVMGMRSWIYWTSNFVFDFVYMIIFSIVSIICAYSFNIQGLSSNSKAVFTITLFWTSIVNVVFCYLLSFFFSNSTSAQLAVFSLVFMFGVMGGVFFNLFNILAVQLTDGARNTMTALATVTFSICGLLPPFHIIAAALSSSIPPASFTPTLTSSWDKQPLSDAISRTYAANSFIYLGILTIFLSFILFAIESPGLRVCVCLDDVFVNLTQCKFCMWCCFLFDSYFIHLCAELIGCCVLFLYEHSDSDLICRYLGPILDKFRAGECFKSPLQPLFQPQHQPQQIDEDVAAEASRMSTHNGNITDILELHG